MNKPRPEVVVMRSIRRAPSSVTLVVATLLLALVAVIATPLVNFWLGGRPELSESD